jgi:hypothetical protein
MTAEQRGKTVDNSCSGNHSFLLPVKKINNFNAAVVTAHAQ